MWFEILTKLLLSDHLTLLNNFQYFGPENLNKSIKLFDNKN